MHPSSIDHPSDVGEKKKKTKTPACLHCEVSKEFLYETYVRSLRLPYIDGSMIIHGSTGVLKFRKCDAFMNVLVPVPRALSRHL